LERKQEKRGETIRKKRDRSSGSKSKCISQCWRSTRAKIASASSMAQKAGISIVGTSRTCTNGGSGEN